MNSYKINPITGEIVISRESEQTFDAKMKDEGAMSAEGEGRNALNSAKIGKNNGASAVSSAYKSAEHEKVAPRVTDTDGSGVGGAVNSADMSKIRNGSAVRRANVDTGGDGCEASAANVGSGGDGREASAANVGAGGDGREVIAANVGTGGNVDAVNAANAGGNRNRGTVNAIDMGKNSEKSTANAAVGGTSINGSTHENGENPTEIEARNTPTEEGNSEDVVNGNGVLNDKYLVNDKSWGSGNDVKNEGVHPGDPNGGEGIPKTAPSRQAMPKVPNRAFTEMSVGRGNMGGVADSSDRGQSGVGGNFDYGCDKNDGVGDNFDQGRSENGEISGNLDYGRSENGEVSKNFDYGCGQNSGVGGNFDYGYGSMSAGGGSYNHGRGGNVKNRQISGYGCDEQGDGDEENGENSENNSQNTDRSARHDRTVTVKSGDKLIKTIVIAGQIEGHSQLPQGQKATRYEEMIPQLVEIEEDDEIGGLLLILNTVGGDVEAGLALSEMIAGMKKPTASLVLGGGHSIGVPLAVSAKRSFIVPSATMTLHPVRITGMILGAPQTYVYMSRMQERIIDFTCRHCRMSPERFNELMLSRDEMSTDLGSVLNGNQAVSEGLIDTLGTLGDAIAFLRGEC